MLIGAPALRRLCAVADIPDGGCKGFDPPSRPAAGLFAVRQGEQVHVYVNSCPHLGVSLDWLPDKFLSGDGKTIVCATHGALFQINDGLCLSGPCYGARLEAVKVAIVDGAVCVPEDAGL